MLLKSTLDTDYTLENYAFARAFLIACSDVVENHVLVVQSRFLSRRRLPTTVQKLVRFTFVCAKVNIPNLPGRFRFAFNRSSLRFLFLNVKIVSV